MKLVVLSLNILAFEIYLIILLVPGSCHQHGNPSYQQNRHSDSNYHRRVDTDIRRSDAVLYIRNCNSSAQKHHIDYSKCITLVAVEHIIHYKIFADDKDSVYKIQNDQRQCQLPEESSGSKQNKESHAFDLKGFAVELLILRTYCEYLIDNHRKKCDHAIINDHLCAIDQIKSSGHYKHGDDNKSKCPVELLLTSDILPLKLS